MAKNKKCLIFSLLFFLFCGLTFAVIKADAADCGSQLDELSRLRGLIERQKLLKQAIVQCPDDYQMNYFYAYNLERLRKYEESLRYYQNAVRLKPDFAKSYVGMGDVYLVLKKNREAIDALKKGIQLDPENIWAQRAYEKAIQLDKSGTGKKNEDAAVRAAAPEPVLSPPVQDIPESTAHASIALPGEGSQKGEKSGESDEIIPQQIEDESWVSVSFLSSANELTDEAKEKLDRIVCRELQDVQVPESRLEIAGHTDDIGPPEHNILLSRIRAEKVRDYLLNTCGVAPQRLVVVYHGQTKPAVPNTSRENRRLNRRVEIRKLSQQ
ncbi:MAG: OmpA family protein [Pseudomonadota bacterium]